MLVCKVAAAQLKAGTLDKTYLEVNRLDALIAVKVSVKIGCREVPAIPGMTPELIKSYNEYMRLKMKYWRARKHAGLS